VKQKKIKLKGDRPIGIFDSGVGGLTVLKEVQCILPKEEIIYFGDTARVPYGGKSKSTIDRFSKQIADFLTNLGAKLIIIACNTASSLSFQTLVKHTGIPVIGVIEPGAFKAVMLSESKRIGVIATDSTVASKAYEKAIAKIDSKVKVVSKSCPLFVPLVEEGWTAKQVTYDIVETYLKFFHKKIDTLVLGCTHYTLLKSAIRKSFHQKIKLVDSANETAIKARQILRTMTLESTRKRTPKYSFYVSDDPQKFKISGERILKKKLTNIKKVILDV